MLQVPDSFASSPNSTTADHVPYPITDVSSSPSTNKSSVTVQPPDLRRSGRSRVAPIWLKDFVQPRSTRVHQDISPSSQSHSLHSAAG